MGHLVGQVADGVDQLHGDVEPISPSWHGQKQFQQVEEILGPIRDDALPSVGTDVINDKSLNDLVWNRLFVQNREDVPFHPRVGRVRKLAHDIKLMPWPAVVRDHGEADKGTAKPVKLSVVEYGHGPQKRGALNLFRCIDWVFAYFIEGVVGVMMGGISWEGQYASAIMTSNMGPR